MIKAIEMGDLKLVHVVEQPKGIITPHCKNHGAMNKVNSSGLWRCVSTYDCRAGCEYSV